MINLDLVINQHTQLRFTSASDWYCFNAPKIKVKHCCCFKVCYNGLAILHRFVMYYAMQCCKCYYGNMGKLNKQEIQLNLLEWNAQISPAKVYPSIFRDFEWNDSQWSHCEGSGTKFFGDTSWCGVVVWYYQLWLIIKSLSCDISSWTSHGDSAAVQVVQLLFYQPEVLEFDQLIFFYIYSSTL